MENDDAEPVTNDRAIKQIRNRLSKIEIAYRNANMETLNQVAERYELLNELLSLLIAKITLATEVAYYARTVYDMDHVNRARLIDHAVAILDRDKEWVKAMAEVPLGLVVKNLLKG